MKIVRTIFETRIEITTDEMKSLILEEPLSIFWLDKVMVLLGFKKYKEKTSRKEQ